MKRFGVYGLALAAVFLAPAAASAREDSGNLRLGIRGGAAFSMQEFADFGIGVDMSPGSNLNAILTYATSEEVHIGGAITWAHHDVESGGVKIAVADPVTFLAQFEYHFASGGETSPYALLGAGFHINLASYTSDVENSCSCKLKADPSFALRVGGGIDHWVSDEAALNAELAWTLNQGTASGPGEFDFDASTLSILVGLRFRS